MIRFIQGIFTGLIAGAAISYGLYYVYKTDIFQNPLLAMLAGAFGASIFTILILIVLGYNTLNNMTRGLQSAEEISEEIGEILVAVKKGELENIQTHTSSLSQSLIKGYLKTNFNWWMIYLTIGVIGLFSIISGTIFLIDQNKEIAKSNRLIADQFKIEFTRNVLIRLSESDLARKNYKDRMLEAVAKLFPGSTLTKETAFEKVGNLLKKSKTISYKKFKEDNELKRVIGIYENISAYAVYDFLDVRLIDEIHGQLMIDLYEATKGHYSKIRCNDDISVNKIYRKRLLENFEALVKCDLKKRQKYKVNKSEREECMKQEIDKIRKTECETQ